jgi:hypothetical protein
MAKLSNILTERTSIGPSDNFKNLIINGAMQVAQRSTSVASITSSGYRTVDRFNFTVGNMGTWTQSVENDAPTSSGFRKSLKMLCTTADASPAASDVLGIFQNIEGQNVQQIAKGTSSAKQLTLSFWVKSNVTGTYIVYAYDNDNNRICSKSYTINASATWEKKTITFPADTTGVLDNDNALSLQIFFSLGVGSDSSSGTLQTTWGTYVAANSRVGQVNVAASTNNYWQITGVQLEVGNTATEFEFLPAQVELALCQRYYEKSYPYATAPGATGHSTGINGFSTSSAQKFVSPGTWKVTKRATPDITVYDGAGNSGKIATLDAGGTGTNNVTIAIIDYNDQMFRNLGSNNGVQSGYSYNWVASAEL